MAITDPEVRLSSHDLRLLILLARLVVPLTGSDNSNVGDAAIALTQSEALELADLLEQFTSSKRFIESAYFVEEVSKPGALNSGAAREIYLSWRARYGRTRAMASTHWREFIARLGIDRVPSGYFAGTSPLETRPMDMNHFLKMETLLLEANEISPRIRALVLQFVSQQLQSVQAVRDGRQELRSDSVRDIPNSVLTEIRTQRAYEEGGRISATRVTATMTLIADMSVMFTTRDWGVAGTLSTMAGALGATANPEN